MLSPRNAQIIALLVISSFVFGAPVQAALGQTTNKTAAQAPATTEQKPDYSQEAVVIEQVAMAYRFERDGTGQRELSLRVKIQSDAGVERFGQLIFPYTAANEKLEMDFVRVRKADGSVVSATASDMQDLSAPLAREAPIYTDLRQKHITVPGLRPGDTLEYRILWNIQSALAQNHFWVEHNFVTRGPIVLNDELTVSVPAASKVKLKTEPGYEPSVKEQSDRRVYSWKQAKLKRDSDEDEKEKEKEDEEGAEEDKDPDEIRPHIQLTTFQSWDEVGQWYADLQKDRVVPDEKIKLKAEEIIKGRATEKEKVTALYEYVAKNFRYVSLSLGQGRYQPHAASDVMSNQYGDCKDKHTLLASMLAATGLRAYPVLINSRRKLDVDMPSPGQFDHVISAIPLGNETLWADTTSEVAPAGLLSPRLRNKQALLVPIAGPARLETTPAEPPFLSSELVTMEGTVDDLGKVTARGKLILHGDTETYMRYMFRRTPKSDWKRLGFYIGMAGGLTGEITDIKTTDPADLAKPFEVEFNVTQKDFLDWSTKKLKLTLPFPPFNLQNFYGRTAKSTKPLEIGPPIDISYSLKLTLPSKYQARLPLPLKVSRDYGEYVASYKLEGQTLLGQRTLRVRQSELPAERLQDYQAFVAAVRSDAAQTLALETEIAGSPALPETLKTEDLLQAAEVALKNDNLDVAEQLLKRVVEKDPKHKTVRRNLGYVLVEQQEYDEAVAVLREQIKINPFEDYAYNLLGRAYWLQQNYTNAEQSFRKQLEVTPLDQTAYTNLGMMLVDARKFKEAVPELERAISLSPEDESLRVSIGRAYLHLGETEKAINAFEEALKIDRDRSVLNDVAYFLAEKATQLDKALEYAESAVSAMATDLRNVQAGNLTIDDLEGVSLLAAYWDTLGWVHFQKGNIDVAEKYVRAAWTVYPASEVAHHLGTIAEKRGNKDEAIRLYAQGSVMPRVAPESRESLARLVSADALQKSLQSAKEQLVQSSAFDLGPFAGSAKATVEAEFYLLFGPDASRNARVVEVKFIKGDESLKAMASQLKSIKYQLVFPDASPTKIVRRGTLRCAPKPGACTFTMVSPETIVSID